MTITAEKTWVSGTPKLWVRHPAGSRQCPGCHHPIIERLIAEVVEEMGLAKDFIMVVGVGCYSRAIAVLDFDGIFTAHGRPPDVATAIKRTLRGKPIVMTLQGDGDCLAIGAEPLMNTVARAEKITILMINNLNYGTTGGQMAPTTLVGQVTSTTPQGRDPALTGFPVHAPESLAAYRGVAYTARGSVHTAANYQRAKKMLKAALQKQVDNIGLSFLELISACPPDWRLNPVESLKFIDEKVIPEYPLGEFKNLDKLV